MFLVVLVVLVVLDASVIYDTPFRGIGWIFTDILFWGESHVWTTPRNPPK